MGRIAPIEWPRPSSRQRADVSVRGVTVTRRVHRQTSPRLLRTVSAVALVAALLGGCSQFSEQTTQQPYSASDGVKGDNGPLGVRNLLLVTDEQGEVATVSGTLVNTSDEPLKVVLGSASGGPGEPIEVPADGVVTLTADDTRIEVPIQSGAGTLVPFVISDVNAQTSGVAITLDVPVLDGTLAEYKTLQPSAGASS